MMQPPAPDLHNRVVVVSGAARGMGREYVEALLESGARVVATDVSWQGDEDFRSALAARGDALVLEMDVSKDEHVEAVYQSTMDRFGTVDALINNAAMRSRNLFPPTGRRTILETADPDWRKMFDVNVFGTLKVIRRFIQPMQQHQRGSIINISTGGSWVALRPDSMEQPYMASKAALTNLSFYLANEVQKDNIAVNVVFPGHTASTGTEEQDAARVAKGMSVRERVQPVHIVPLVLFLAGIDASYGLTGKALQATEWNLLHGLGSEERWTRSGLAAVAR
jgi:NAD(P)-dependent dehydrogenase (short-subunit alcohol dehydrogenase family)